MGRPSSFAPLHQLGFVCHIPGLSIHSPASASTSNLDRDSARQLGFVHSPPPLTHALSPLPHCRLHSANPLSFISNFRLPGQSQPGQQTARCQRGQHSLGVPPEADSLYRPAGDCHVIEIPQSSYTRLSARVDEPTSPCFNAHSEQRPKISRTHCFQLQLPDAEAHSSPTTPRQPGRLTLPLPLTLTSQRSQRSTLQPGRFPWLKLLAPGLQEQGQARQYHPMIVAWLGD